MSDNETRKLKKCNPVTNDTLIYEADHFPQFRHLRTMEYRLFTVNR